MPVAVYEHVLRLHIQVHIALIMNMVERSYPLCYKICHEFEEFSQIGDAGLIGGTTGRMDFIAASPEELIQGHRVGDQRFDDIVKGRCTILELYRTAVNDWDDVGVV